MAAGANMRATFFANTTLSQFPERIEGAQSFSDTLHQVAQLISGKWAWAYKPHLTTRRDAKVGTDATFLKDPKCRSIERVLTIS